MVNLKKVGRLHVSEARKKTFYQPLGFNKSSDFFKYMRENKVKLSDYESTNQLTQKLEFDIKEDERHGYNVMRTDVVFNGAIRNTKVEFKSGRIRPPTTPTELYRSIVHFSRMIDGHVQRVNLTFTSVDGKAYNRLIPIDTLENFTNALHKIMTDGHLTKGSDQGVLIGANFDYELFTLVEFRKINVGGDYKKVESKFYIIKNIESQNNDCFVVALKYALNHRKSCDQLRERVSIKKGEMIDFKHIAKFEKMYKCRIDIYDDMGYNNCLRKSNNKCAKRHIRMLFVDMHYTLIIRDRKFRSRKEHIKKGTKIIYYDVESVYNKNKNNNLQTYSVAYYIHDVKDKYIHDEDKVKQTKLITALEYDEPMKEFIKDILRLPTDYNYIIAGYNNSRFDDFFLADDLYKMGENPLILYVNNSILSMKFKNYKTFDLCRFTASSLKTACDSFKTNPKKIEGFSHRLPQKAFEKGLLNEWIKDNYEKLESYNKIDVLALADLTNKVSDAVFKLLKVNIFDFMTIGQMAYSVWYDNKQVDTPRPKSYEDDLFIRSALTAGRTQSYFGAKHLKGRFKMIDVKSLYPFVMLNSEFPVGEYDYTDKYIEGKLGIYKCKIIHQNMKWQNKSPMDYGEYMGADLKTAYAPVVYPKRSDKTDEPLNWNYRGEMECNLTSVDIECINRNGGKVEVFNGVYWNESSRDVFKHFLVPLMNEKNKQDVLKTSKSLDFNASLRELCKLLSNSLSGKVIQRNFEDMTENVRKLSQVNKFLDKCKDDSVEYFNYGANLLFLKGKKKEEHIFKKSSKPSYLGVFIYAHSRNYMYETILNKYITLYQDTDSALMHHEEFERFKSENKEIYQTGVYGSLEEEVGNATELFTVRPKCYAVFNYENPSKSKLKFKGIRKDDKWTLGNNIKDVEQYYEDEEAHKVLSKEFFQAIYNVETKRNELMKQGYDDKQVKEMTKDMAVAVYCSQLTKNMGEVSKEYNKDITPHLTIRQVFLIKIF